MKVTFRTGQIIVKPRIPHHILREPVEIFSVFRLRLRDDDEDSRWPSFGSGHLHRRAAVHIAFSGGAMEGADW